MNLGDKKLEKDLKPKLYWPIWNTIICSGPPLNLIFRYFLIKDIKNPTSAIILTVIAMIWSIINWYWYVKERNNYNKSWEKTSVEFHALNPQEEHSKDIIGTIFDILMLTITTSLVMSIIFAIAILAKLTFFKYLMLLSLLVFFITAGGLMIIGTIQLIRFIRIVIKGGRLKKVLRRVIVIYTLSFIILIIINFIIHKNLEWIEIAMHSVLITLPISVSTEVVMFCKEIKKDLSLNTSSEEDDR